MIKIDISIVIVTYQSQELLPECMDSILKFLDIPQSNLEVLIVDNSSGSDAAEIKTITETHPICQIISTTYIQNTANLGYGQGNNVGIKSARGEVVCIMNPDVRFTEPLLKDVKIKFRDQNLGLHSYSQMGGFNYSFYLKPEYKNRWSTILTKFANRIDRFYPKYFYLSGAFFFVNKKKFEEIGLFDENIFLYFEEPDIAKRLQDKDYLISYDNSKNYQHLVGDRREWSPGSFSSEMKSLKYYIEKFNFNTSKIIKNFLAEYQIKIWVGKLISDKTRVHKFENEMAQIKEIFRNTN